MKSMGDENTAIARKVVAVPFVLLFMNSLFIIYAPQVYSSPASLAPISFLSAVVCIDVAIRPISAKEDRFNGAILALAFLLFPLMVSLPYFEWIYLTSSILSDSREFFLVIGLSLLLLGSLTLIAGRLQIGRYGGPRIVIENDHHLITTGMYRYVRNPQYLGFLLLLFGYAFSLGSILVASLVLLGLFIILRSRIILEEKILLDAFGEEYRRYMDRTWRLLPRIY